MWLYKMNETIQQKPQLLVPVFLLVTNDQIEQKEKKENWNCSSLTLIELTIKGNIQGPFLFFQI